MSHLIKFLVFFLIAFLVGMVLNIIFYKEPKTEPPQITPTTPVPIYEVEPMNECPSGDCKG